MDDLRERLQRAGERVSPPEPGYERLLDRRQRRQRNGRIGAAVLALVVTAGLLGGLLVAVGGRERRVTPGAPGAGDPGPSAEGAGSLAIGPGQYFYERAVGIVPDLQGVQPGWWEVESWWSTDGSGRVEAHSETESWSPGESGEFGPGEFPVSDDLSRLSTDPSVLADQLRQRSAPGGASPQPEVTPAPGVSREEGALYRAVDALLRMPNASPELRRALFEVLSGATAVEIVYDVEDPTGRKAILVRFFAEAADRRFYFSPGTLQPMAIVEDYGQDGGEWTRIVLEAGIVDSTEAGPSRKERLFPRAEWEPPA